MGTDLIKIGTNLMIYPVKIKNKGDDIFGKRKKSKRR